MENIIEETIPEDDESRLSIASETKAVSVDVDNGYLGQSDGETEENDNNAVSRPTSSAVRMPGGLRKPRLSRTPGEASRKGLDEKGSSSDEDDELNVLITEMPSSAREAADAAEQSGRTKPLRRPPSHRKTKTPQANTDDQDDELWDTDLEIDYSLADNDPTGKTTYIKTCENLGVVPVSYFTRHITDPEIVMRYRGLGPQGARAMARVLRDSLSLEKLNLTGNNVTGVGALHMARMLIDNDYISELCLADNQLGSLGAYHMSKMLLVNTGLRKLDLSGNGIGDTDAGYMAEAIEKNQALKELNLSHNDFGVEGGIKLGSAIGANDIMEVLDLSWNKLRRRGAVAVAKGVKENVRLKKCNLAWNGFGPDGGLAIAEAIAYNRALLELDISGNRLDYRSATSISRALKRNEELEVLRIGNNPITTAGCINIIKAINENDGSIVHTVDFTGIPVEFEFLRLVDEVKNKRETEFTVTYGTVLRAGNTPQDIGKPAIDPYPKNPLLILREHIVVNDFRILDILQKADTEGTLSVTPDQFAEALEELGVPFTREQIDDVARKLDKNDDGRIYYGDLLEQKTAVEAESAAVMSTTNTENTVLNGGESSLLVQSDASPLVSQIIEKETSSHRSSNASPQSTKSSKSSIKKDIRKATPGSTPKKESSSKKQSANPIPAKRSPKASPGGSLTSSRKGGEQTSKSSLKSQELSFSKSEIAVE